MCCTVHRSYVLCTLRNQASKFQDLNLRVNLDIIRLFTKVDIWASLQMMQNDEYCSLSWCSLNWSNFKLLALCESTLSFWQTKAKIMIEHNLCWSSVDMRGHVTDGTTKSYHRWVPIGSLALSLFIFLRCETQMHRNRWGYEHIPW